MKQFFEFMADEELEHIEMLSRQFKSYQAEGLFLSSDGVDARSQAEPSSVLTDDIQKKISAAGFEAAAISAAMAMEQRAIHFYSDRAVATKDADERALYEWLAEWERGHLRLLNNMDKELTEKIWYDNQFWPF
jgi:rubrerythrin